MVPPQSSWEKSMSTANNEVRELTVGELDAVAGAVHVVEFKMGLIMLQFDIKCGGYTLWNGNDPVPNPEDK
jgi:hypothetical protein